MVCYEEVRIIRAEYIDHMGDDLAVANAARVSFDKESDWETDGFPGLNERLSEKDTKLIRYLAKHNHWTPFAHTSIKLRMQAPVPITVQCYKHKAGFVENGESRRYVDSRPELFIPEFRSRPEGSIKQGSGDIHPNNDRWKSLYEEHCNQAINLYMGMIENDIAPEQARFILPQGVELNWIWTGSLAAYARFYKQRIDSHAQKEIQDLAGKVGDIIRPLFPVSWEALVD